MPFIDTNSTSSWVYDPVLGGIKRIVLPVDTNIRYIKNSLSPVTYTFTQLKNYQLVTGITGSGQLGTFSIKFKAPFTTDSITLRNTVLTNGGIKFYTYNTPTHNLKSDVLCYYGSDNTFINSVIQSTRVNELSFLINGFREFTYLDRDIATSSQPSGWFYEQMPGDAKPSYNIFLSATSSSIPPSYSIFGTGLSVIQSSKNYIAKYIEYDTFNLDFKFYTSISSIDMKIYLLTLDKLATPNEWGSNLVGTFSNTGTYNKLGLAGTNYDGSKNYLVFSCDIPQFLPARNPIYVGSTLTLVDISAKISDINVYGTYHPISNNRLALTDTTTSPIGLSISNAAYSYALLNNGATFSLPSRIGNGSFRSGIWENGVWNNGWRDDTVSQEFNDVYISVLTASDVSWKVEIRGAISAIEGFATGSNVSIGNIVAIDINDNRKLLRDYYQIESLGIDVGDPINGIPPYGWIRVNLDTSFPYRRIERDSPNHKIKVTKNVWLSGGFFNGYFSGVWNNGLFKGYPLLTEMFNSQWIDGVFDGGRFNSNYSVEYTFVGIGPKVACSNNFMDLTFPITSITKLLPGDYIFITLNSLVGGSIGAGVDIYSGVCQIVDIKIDTNGEQIVTINKRSIGLPAYKDYTYPAGSVYRYTASSVIQNFKFYDNNRSKIKSSESNLSNAVFNFNSWIDVNYDSTRAVTLAKDFRSYEPLTGKSVNRNNLYGYPTYDILSSASRFRDSNTLDFKLYRLGTKYKVFTDFIGEYSQFNEPFNDLDFSNFINGGWTYSYAKPGYFSLKRTETLITLNNSQSIALLNSGVTGDELFVTASNTGFILNNNKVSINKSRYSVVEFDVVTYSVATPNYTYDNPDIYQERSINNLGLSFSQTVNIGYLTSSYILNGTTNLEIDDVVIMVDIYGDILGTTINLKAPNGKIINLKKLGSGLGNRMTQTKFGLRDVYTKFSYITTPYSLNNNTVSYSDTYQMDREVGQGDIPFLSDITKLSELTTDGSGGQQIYGPWTLYVKYNSTAISVCTLTNWSIDIQYKHKVSSNTEPTSSLPILNFSNLNYDITTQLSGYDNVQVYKKMNYLPISDNVNHLLSKNTFRLDSVELATPDRWGGFGKNQKTKKYEYFYNKTDMMLNITGNGLIGASTSMVVLDNLNMYEVDMIPFFKYFDNANIYRGIQFPYVGTSPEIDYTSSDFVFIDNISIGLDSINPTALDTTFISCGTVSFANLQLSASLIGRNLPYTQSTSDTTFVTTTSYQIVNMNNTSIQGSATCSTTFDSISWSIQPNIAGVPQPTLTMTNTLYPLISGLTAGGEYTISIDTMTKNTTPTQTTGTLNGTNITAIITVATKPKPIISVIPLSLSFNLVPNDGLSHAITEANLLHGYVNNYLNGSPSGNYANDFIIKTLPLKGNLVYNGTPVTVPFPPINIVNDLIPGLVYYANGYPTVVPQNSTFNTSFEYQIIDNQGYEIGSPNLPTNAIMTIVATIVPSTVTVVPVSKMIDYDLNESSTTAAKYFSESEITQGYTNYPNNFPADHIKIYGIPSRGELSLYNGTSHVPVVIGQTILISDINLFAYWPQSIGQTDTYGGNFSRSFEYSVFDNHSNESNQATFNLDCTDITSNITGLPPVLKYIGSTEYQHEGIGATDSFFTATGNIVTLIIKNNQSNGTIHFTPILSPGGVSTVIHLYGNPGINPVTTTTPHDGDELGPGQTTLLTFNRSAVPNGKYSLTIFMGTPTPGMPGYYTSGAYNWFFTLA